MDQGPYCPAHTLKRRKGSTRSWRKLRAQILARDRYRCQLCGGLATHVDHIRPWSAGGSSHPANLQSLCERCNKSKGASVD
jgi:5-methylcytosine-specific restriction protein A